jgi:RHS repeat-associated protein
MKRILTVMLLLLVAGTTHATPQRFRTASNRPASASTSGVVPQAPLSDEVVVHKLDATSQPAFYGAPYYTVGWYTYDPTQTLQEQIDADWLYYKQVWGVSPYGPLQCNYIFAPSGDGVATGNFGGISWHGQCYGGNEIAGTSYPFDPRKNNGCPGGCAAGDPINLGTGNEYEDQEDYSAPGQLQFDRFYNSSPAVASTHIGANWRDSFDRSIEYLTDGTTFTATVFRPDGKEPTFQKTNGVWTADPDIHDTLLENDDSQGNVVSWTYFDADAQQIETYNASGLLTAIESLNGQATTLAYSDASTPPSTAPAPGLLISVTGPRGRQLQFVYNVSSQITQVTLPDGGTLAYAYDASGNLTQVTYPDGHTRAYKYDETSNAPSGFPNLLTGIIDENGQRYADIHYDSQGRATSSQLGGIANLVQVAYNAGTSTVTWPLGVQSTIGFTIPLGRMRVSSNSQPCGRSCNQNAATQTYDANGNPASSADFNGVTTAYAYDADGLQTQRIEAQGTPVQRTIDTTWDTVWRNPLERTRLDAGGTLTAKTDWAYNSRGQVLARCEEDPTVAGATGYACSTTGTPPAGVRRWTYTYCDAIGGPCPQIGLLLAVDGPRTDVPDVTQYAYYQSTDESGCGTPGGACHRAGDLWTVTDALGHVTTTASYDMDGRPTETIDPNGLITTFTYTPRGWLHTRTVSGATTSIDYDAVGDVVKVTQPDGVFTTYGYDTAHRLTSVGDALGDHVNFTLDAAGNRIAEKTYAAGSSTPSRSLSRVYNNLGELVTALDAYGHATGYTYDADGNRTGVTDALGVATHESYDALSRLAQTVRNYLGNDPATANTTTSFTYDSRDNVSQVTDPDGLATDYYHDGLDDLGQLLSPDTGTTNYTYDAAGNRISKTDARGVISTYAYDALNRLTSISYPTASQDVQYHYGEPGSITGCTASYPVGHLTRMADSSGSTTYCYDDHGNVTSKRQIIGADTRTTTYAYNVADRLMGVGYPDGASVSYTRDADGRIASVAAVSATGVSTPVVTAISYLPYGPASGYAFGNGQIQTKTFDQDYRPTGVVSTPLYLQYTLDAVGNPIALQNAPGQSAPVESYAYGPLDRLQQVDDSTGAPWQSYTYDKTGDRLTKTTAGIGTDDYQYQSGTHRLIDITGAEPSARAMDANGNTTGLQASGGIYALGYDDSNRFTVLRQSGVTIEAYTINGQGERVSKTAASVRRGPPICHAVPYRPVSMTCRSPTGVATDFVYDGSGRLLGEFTTGHSRDYVWAGNTLVAILDNPALGGDTIHYAYTDNLGTPRAVTTQSGTLVWDWPNTRNPFGERAASGNGYTLNLRFPGQYFDAETGLSYNYFRDYESAIGRYVESDPVGLQGGLSTYAYVSNAPLKSYDAKGMVKWTGGYLFAGVSAFVGGEVDTYNLMSDCSGGKSAIVTVIGLGTNFSFSPVPIGVVSGPIEFDDGDATPNPQNFQGFYDRSGGDFTAGIGGGVGHVTVGGESADFRFVPSPEFGISVGLGAVLGSSIVTSSAIFNCGCSK